MIQVILIYIAAANIIALILYGLDKHKAKTRAWRISEKTLIGIALIGGSLGSIIGMQLFHHKTKHWYFRIGLPVILAMQILLGIIVYVSM